VKPNHRHAAAEIPKITFFTSWSFPSVTLVNGSASITHTRVLFYCLTRVMYVYGSSKCFDVKVGRHWGSALSQLLFVIDMDMTLRIQSCLTMGVVVWWWLGCDSWNLVVIAETEDDLIIRLNEWNDYVKNRGMSKYEWSQKAARCLCGVCGRGIGSNSIQYTSCQKRVHKKCSGIKGSMCKAMMAFVCRGCVNSVIGTGYTISIQVLILLSMQIWS